MVHEAAKIEVNQSVAKETIPIKIPEGKDRFQIGAFLDTPITLLM